MKILARSIKSLIGRDKKNPAAARDFLLNEMPRNSVCAEIGVYRGDFSQRIVEVVSPARLHLVDPWKFQESEVYGQSLYGGERGENQANMDAIYESVNRRFAAPIKERIVTLHRANSIDAAGTFADNYFDWIYIDGDHQYEFVKADLHAWFPKIKPGGFIAGDDYGEGGWWKGGVKKAVDEFMRHGTSASPVESRPAHVLHETKRASRKPAVVENVQIKGRQFWFKKNLLGKGAV
jgi:hypothetical protein